MHNKKGIIQFGIIAIALAVIVVGFLAFNPFKINAISEQEAKQNVDNQLQPPLKPCPAGYLRDNDNNCLQQQTSNGGQQQTIPSNPSPPLNPSPGSGVTQCNQPSGFFSIVYARQKQWVNTGTLINQPEHTKADIVGIFKYTGNCPTDIYIEAGIVNAPISGLLAFLPSAFKDTKTTGAPSNCDGNTHYNGMVAHVEPNSDILFRLRPENYGSENTYPINIGAYAGGSRTGCINYGGYTITELHDRISFSDKYSIFELTNSYEQVK